jgi:hypothetical protein
VIIPIRLQEADATPIDASGMSLLFSAGDRLEKMLEDDPDFVGGKLLVITEEEADNFSTRWSRFSLLDQTTSPSLDIWPGLIRRDK